MKIASWAVLLLIFAAGGQIVQAAQGDRCVEIWNLWSDRLRHEVNLDTGAVSSTPMARTTALYAGLNSPDGRFNVSFHQQRNARNRIMLTDRGRGISVKLAENASSPSWSPDSGWLAYMQLRDDRRPVGLALYNMATGERVFDPLPENDWEALGLHWSPDGSLIAATFVVDRIFESSDVRLYTTPDLKLAKTFTTRLSIASIRWSPDGKRIAGYGTNNEFALMDVESGAMVSQKLGGEGYYQLDWSKQGTYLLVKYSIGELGQWMKILNMRGEILVDSTWITAHEWVQDHQVLLRVGTNSGEDDLVLIDLESGERRVILSQVGLHTLSPEGRYVAAKDATAIQIFDLLGIEPTRVINEPDALRSLVWEADGQHLVGLFGDRSVRELALDDGTWRMIATVPGDEWMVRRAVCR